MAIKTIYIGDQGPFKYDDQRNLDDPDGLFAGIKQSCIVTDGDLQATVVKVTTLDADQLNQLETKSYFFGLF
jgi:hypothetical protein